MGNKSGKAAAKKQAAKVVGATDQTPLHEDDFFLRPMGHHGLCHSVQVMAYSNVQRLLAIGTSTGIVKLFGRNSFEVLLQNQYSRSAIISMNFNRSGSKLFTFSADTEFRVIDMLTYQVLGGLSLGWTRGAHIMCVHMPPDTDHPFIYAGLSNGYVEVINTLTTERTGYRISSTSIDVDPDEEDLVFMASDPSDLNRLLLGYEKLGPVLWDLAKKRIVKHYQPSSGLLELNLGDDASALTCGAFHNSGTQFVVGYSSGYIVVYDTSKASSGKLQSIGHAMNPVEYPKPVTCVRWACSNDGKNGAGTLLVAGGHDMNAVTMLWQKPSSHHEKWKCGDVGIPGLDEDRVVYGMTLATYDASPVLDFLLTYPQGCGPYSNALDSHPDGYIVMSGDPQGGVDVRLGVQPLPTKPGNTPWPPAACNPPEPMPQVIHFTGMLRGLGTKMIVDCGVCPNDMIQAIKDCRPPPRGHPEGWVWPISGGSRSQLDPKGAQHLLATGHNEGTVALWACGPPGDNKVAMKLACLSSSCECIYEFEPRFLCEQGGFKPPDRPKPYAITLCLQSRLLCIGCQSGEVLVCTVKPGNKGSTGSAGASVTGSAVYLLHCLQGVHTAPVTHLALMAQSGKLAIADQSGQISLLNLETGHHELLAVPVPKVPNGYLPIRSMIVGSVPCMPSEGETADAACVSVPMLFVGFANGEIAVCQLSTGDPLRLIFPPNDSKEPISFMVLINKKGVPPIEPVTRKFTKKISATDETDADVSSTEKKTVNAEGSDTTTASVESNMPIGKRFLLVVAGPEVRVLQLKFPPISQLLSSGMQPMNIDLIKSAKLNSAPVSISCASIFASHYKNPGEYPALVGIDNFNHLTCLSLPMLNPVYEQDITSFENIEDIRCRCIMASGDAIIVTKKAAVHRYALPISSMLGYDQRPKAFKQEWGRKSIVAAGMKLDANAEKAMKKKKKKPRKSMMMGWSTHKPADLTKTFASAQLRMEQEQEMNHRELGIDGEDSFEEAEDSNPRTRANNAVGETKNVMAENINKLNERGEQIAAIQEQTSRMVLNAMLFEEQCKQIKQQQDDDCVVQ